MNEHGKKVYHLTKGNQLNNELLGMDRFELSISDTDGNLIGKIDPKYMFCGVVIYPNAVECLIVNEGDMTRSYGNIRNLSLELNEKEKFFTINDDQERCLSTTISVDDVNFNGPYSSLASDVSLI